MQRKHSVTTLIIDTYTDTYVLYTVWFGQVTNNKQEWFLSRLQTSTTLNKGPLILRSTRFLVITLEEIFVKKQLHMINFITMHILEEQYCSSYGELHIFCETFALQSHNARHVCKQLVDASSVGQSCLIKPSVLHAHSFINMKLQCVLS